MGFSRVSTLAFWIISRGGANIAFVNEKLTTPEYEIEEMKTSGSPIVLSFWSRARAAKYYDIQSHVALLGEAEYCPAANSRSVLVFLLEIGLTVSKAYSTSI